jgi:hypothetical protein
MPRAWSYSSMSLFQQCPKKYYHLKVAKDVIDPPSVQMRYGLDAHKAAEDYVREGAALPAHFAFMKEPLDRLRQMEGEHLCEHRMGLDEDMEPCKFFDKAVWWRGIADLLVINGEKASLIDYKSGKNTYPDTKQLELLSLAVFKHFPEVQTVKAGLLFVVHPALVKERFEATEQIERWKKWHEQSMQLDEAYENGVWNPKQNFTCKGWCPVLSCEHNGKAR